MRKPWLAASPEHGKVYISLRYGTRMLELSKGKSAIEVGEMKQLVPVIEALKRAAAAGELDAQIDAAGTEAGKRFLNV